MPCQKSASKARLIGWPKISESVRSWLPSLAATPGQPDQMCPRVLVGLVGY